MKYQLLFSLAAAVLLLPGEAPAQPSSSYQYQRTVVGPEGSVYHEQRAGGVAAGPFGATSGMTRSGSFVGPGGETVEYNERHGSVVGPVGGGGVANNRYSSHAAVGPVGGLAAGRALTAPIEPFAAADFPLPEGPPGLGASNYQYQRTVVGPEGGEYNEQRTGGGVVGPFGATSGMTRSGSYVGPDGATVEFHQQHGSVVGPLGGGWTGGTTEVHAASADRGLFYSRYSSSGSTFGPVGGAAVGGYGAVGYRRSAVVTWP
jgi:hypothetical protein